MLGKNKKKPSSGNVPVKEKDNKDKDKKKVNNQTTKKKTIAKKKKTENNNNNNNNNNKTSADAGKGAADQKSCISFLSPVDAPQPPATPPTPPAPPAAQPAPPAEKPAAQAIPSMYRLPNEAPPAAPPAASPAPPAPPPPPPAPPAPTPAANPPAATPPAAVPPATKPSIDMYRPSNEIPLPSHFALPKPAAATNDATALPGPPILPPVVKSSDPVIPSHFALPKPVEPEKDKPVATGLLGPPAPGAPAQEYGQEWTNDGKDAMAAHEGVHFEKLDNYYDLPEDEVAVTMEEDRSERKNRSLRWWLKRTLEMGIPGLKKEFKEIPNDVPPASCTSFQLHPNRNRYYNVPCLDKTRFQLSNDPQFYIHANYVTSGSFKNRFLCSQAPMTVSLEEFWKMVIVSEVEYIVMLCDLVEKGKPKCVEYIPTNVGQTTTIGTTCTILKESSIELEKKLIINTIRVTKLSDNTSFVLKHVYWQNWPDHGVPDSLSMPFRIISFVRESRKPILVHCSAGVGRTGTLVLIALILENIRSHDFGGTAKLLMKLREERLKAVQTELQYLYVHRCVVEYLVVKKYSKPNAKDYNKFKEDYQKACLGPAAEK